MPTTIGVIILFAVLFMASILWATRGHTASSDDQGDVTGHPGKSH